MRYTYMFVILLSVSLLLCSCGWKVDGMERLEDIYLGGDEDCDGECAEVTEDGDTSVEDGDSTEENTDGDEDTGTDGDIEVEKDENINLSGSWAMMMVLNGTMSPIGVPWNITLTNLFIATVDENEETISLAFCDQLTTITGSSGFGETEVPQALKDALAESPIEIDLENHQTIPETKVVWTWGINLENPETDDISGVGKDDSRVFDQDDDGEVAVTMNVKKPAGDRYMIRRAIWELDKGELSEDQMWIDGTLQFQVDEKALEATDSMLMTVAPIESSTEGNTYTLHRMSEPVVVDGDEEAAQKADFKAEDAITCEQLIQDYETIFSR